MLRLLTTFAFAVLGFASAGGAAAQDTKKDKKGALYGVWTRETGGIEIKLDFSTKDVLKASLSKGTDGMVATCKITTKDGVVKAEVTKVEEKGEFPMKPPVGFEFGFKWAAKGKTAELSDLTGDNPDSVKQIVQGEYKNTKPGK